jgi:hypothetical protein
LALAPRAAKLMRDVVRPRLRDTTASARKLGERVARQTSDLRRHAAEGLTKIASAVAP